VTTLDHIERVKKLAKTAQAAVEWDAQSDPYANVASEGIEKLISTLSGEDKEVCTCPTCGVVNARLRAELMRRGWSKAAVHHVHIEGYDCRGAAHPYLASVRVDGVEVYRVERDLAEAIDPDVLDDIERRLRFKCSQ
jgi:hypothetical protein